MTLEHGLYIAQNILYSYRTATPGLSLSLCSRFNVPSILHPSLHHLLPFMPAWGLVLEVFVMALLVCYGALSAPLQNNSPFLLPTCPSFLFLLSFSSSCFEGFFHTWEGQSSTQQLIFSILVKWSPFTKSPLHLSVLIARVYRPYNSLCTLLADIVADIERLTIMSPCFTLQLKLHCLVCYVLLALQSWLCIPLLKHCVWMPHSPMLVLFII